MWFEILGKISNIEIIAVGKSIRELNRLKKVYGKGRWRKMKGMDWLNYRIVKSSEPSSIGMKRMALAAKNIKSKNSLKGKHHETNIKHL